MQTSSTFHAFYQRLSFLLSFSTDVHHWRKKNNNTANNDTDANDDSADDGNYDNNDDNNNDNKQQHGRH